MRRTTSAIIVMLGCVASARGEMGHVLPYTPVGRAEAKAQRDHEQAMVRSRNDQETTTAYIIGGSIVAFGFLIMCGMAMRGKQAPVTTPKARWDAGKSI